MLSYKSWTHHRIPPLSIITSVFLSIFQKSCSFVQPILWNCHLPFLIVLNWLKSRVTQDKKSSKLPKTTCFHFKLRKMELLMKYSSKMMLWERSLNIAMKWESDSWKERLPKYAERLLGKIIPKKKKSLLKKLKIYWAKGTNMKSGTESVL